MSEQRVNWQKIFGNNKYGLKSVFHEVEEEERQKEKENRYLKLLVSYFIIVFILGYILQEIFPWLNDRKYVPRF